MATPSTSINILFLGGAKRVSLAERFIAAGKSLGRRVAVFSYELRDDVPISSLAHILIGKKWSSADVVDHLAACISEHHIDIVLPFVDAATVVAARLNALKLPEVFIPVSDVATCEVFFDKVLSNDWFVKQSLPVPEPDPASVPCIAKPRRGSASQGLVILKEQSELESFRRGPDHSEYLLQRFVEADEYTVDCYASPSRDIKCIVPRRRLETSGGEVVRTVTVRDRALIELSHSVLCSAAFVGPITIQFLRDAQHRDYIMEVNPRFGGGVIAAIEAGANIPLMVLRDFLGLPNPPVDDWRENLVMMRAHREFFRLCD